MKAKTRQKIAKWFAIFVVILMIFQVLLPLFSSNYMNSATTADATAAGSETAAVVEIAPGTETVTTTAEVVPATPSSN